MVCSHNLCSFRFLKSFDIDRFVPPGGGLGEWDGYTGYYREVPKKHKREQEQMKATILPNNPLSWPRPAFRAAENRYGGTYSQDFFMQELHIDVVQLSFSYYNCHSSSHPMYFLLQDCTSGRSDESALRGTLAPNSSSKSLRR